MTTPTVTRVYALGEREYIEYAIGIRQDIADAKRDGWAASETLAEWEQLRRITNRAAIGERKNLPPGPAPCRACGGVDACNLVAHGVR